MKNLHMLTLTCLAIIGCQANKPKTMPTTPVSGEMLTQMRAEFMKAEPDARLGSVDAVLASAMYVTVGQITPADFPVDTAVAIIDSSRHVIANGTVVRVFDTSVHVHYETVSGQRAPRVGDVAVRFEAGRP